MARHLAASLSIVSMCLSCVGAQTSSPINVVPLPAAWSNEAGGSFPVASPLQLTGNCLELQSISSAWARFLAKSLTQYRSDGSGAAGCAVQWAGTPAIATVNIVAINASEVLPMPGDNESYSLVVASDKGIEIGCPQVQGCLHALTVLGQLVSYNFTDGGCYSLPGVTINDAPRFGHRSLLLDTARHFYPVAGMKQLLDAMATVRLNVLHWHLVDDQSFPLLVPGTRLAEDGAFSPASMYSAGDVRDVVDYARLRGIRVVPEIDTPGHSASWCAAHPEACLQCKQSPIAWALDPSKNATFALVQAVFATLRSVFIDPWLHIGGDEIDLHCWMQDPTLAAWLQAKYPNQSLNDAAASEAYGSFIPTVMSLATSAGFSRAIVWEDPFDFSISSPSCGSVAPALPTDITIVEVFRAGWGPNGAPSKGLCGVNTTYTTQAAVASGYQVIWMPPSSWYLTCYADSCGTDGGGAGWEPWQQVYSGDPFDSIPDPAQQKMVLGGEATIWGERLDAATMLAVVFPRAAVVAERLWSPQGTNNATLARPRFEALRSYLLSLGLPASSLDGGNEASQYGLPSRPAGPGL